MSRDLSADMLSGITASVVRPAYFVFLDLDSGPVRLWSGIGTYTMDDEEFVGVGTLGAISPIEETKSVVANGVSLSLSGIPEEMIALAMGEKYRGRNVYIWMALFNVSDGTLILNPEQVFAGRLDTMSISDAGETSTITIACESRLIDLERSRERRYTNEDQKYLYPADASLRYVAGLQGKEFPWGVKDVYIGHDGRTLASETLDPANLFGSNNRNNFFDPLGLFG